MVQEAGSRSLRARFPLIAIEARRPEAQTTRKRESLDVERQPPGDHSCHENRCGLLEIVTAGDSNTKVVIEATYGWYWHDA